MQGQLANCPKCGKLFTKTDLRSVCDPCFREQEKMFDTVYRYIRKKENRQASMSQIIEETEVDETLLIRLVQQGRLHVGSLPNFGYPCERCNKPIKAGKICDACQGELKTGVAQHDKQQEQKRKEEESKKLKFFTKD